PCARGPCPPRRPGAPAPPGRHARPEGARRLCGKPRAMGKIYGGQDAEAGQWPWQASLLYKGSHLCGAALIDSHWLVSAAHCFFKKSRALENYQVLLGYTRLYQQTQHTQKMSVNQIITHPDFEKLHPFGSDIAMLQLALPVDFTFYIAPVCLPSADMQLPSNASCWITGWGITNHAVRLLPPFNLQEGKVILIENMFCNFLYGQITSTGNTYYVHEDMVCAGDFSTGKSICQGDSGGPLVCYVPSAWVLVGLGSWGLDCRHPVYPGIFTRVTYFADWINKIKRLTPLPAPTSAPPLTGSQPQRLRAAGSPGPCTALVPPQTWLLLPFTLRARG
uniref:Peptidase S1 domain-containing protein n=1 Tax=Prolemur simus TaxID=1328070 RepID=A0A8C8YM73_PROSS